MLSLRVRLGALRRAVEVVRGVHLWPPAGRVCAGLLLPVGVGGLGTVFGGLPGPVGAGFVAVIGQVALIRIGARESLAGGLPVHVNVSRLALVTAGLARHVPVPRVQR